MGKISRVAGFVLAVGVATICWSNEIISSSYETLIGEPTGISPTRRLSMTSRAAKEKKTRLYDLVLEYDEPEYLKHEECVRKVVKEKLAENVFEFVVKEGLIEDERKEEFLDDWEVEVTDVEEVEVVTVKLPDEPCQGDACTVTTLVDEDECEDGSACGRMLTNAKKKRNKKNRKNRNRNRKRRKYLVRSRAKCDVCYPDSDDRRQLSWRVLGSEDSGGRSGSQDIASDTSSSGDSSSSGQSKHYVRREHKEVDGNQERTSGHSSENRVKTLSQVKQEVSPPPHEHDVTEKQEILAPTENNKEEHTVDHTNANNSHHGRLRIFIRIIIATIDFLIKAFQDMMAQRFEEELDSLCEEFIARSEFIYVPVESGNS